MNLTDYDVGDDGDYGPFTVGLPSPYPPIINPHPKTNFMKEMMKRGRALRELKDPVQLLDYNSK